MYALSQCFGVVNQRLYSDGQLIYYLLLRFSFSVIRGQLNLLNVTWQYRFQYYLQQNVIPRVCYILIK